MSDDTFRKMASQTVRQLQASLAAEQGENERLRSALITWRNCFESGNIEALHMAFAAGNAVLGVPDDLSKRECIAVQTIWSRALTQTDRGEAKTPPTA